uniref:Putative secreted protein n=2 Tax=Ixodes ricinus TaxID=34613 RepID=A0A090XAU8_IXORI
MMTLQNKWFVLLVLLVLFTIDANGQPTTKRPAVCNMPPKKPSVATSTGYTVYYFDKREGKCKCYWNPQGSRQLGGNAFQDSKSCRNTCKGGTPTVCIRRGSTK